MNKWQAGSTRNIIFHTFKLAVYNNLGFHRDELLYFSLGQHLASGYASVPPWIGFISWIVIHTLGYGLFGVWLYSKPKASFRKFWKERVTGVTNPFQF